MSESDTMFNEQDRRCTTVQLMLSTNPSYENRMIASTLKMQIWTVQRLKAQLNALDDPSDGYGYGLWCGFKWGPHHATSHLWSQLESQHQSVPGFSGAIRWPVADPGCDSRTRRRPTCPKRPRLDFRRSATTLYPSFTGPLPPTGLLCLVICREHHQHDLPQHQSQPDRRHPPSIQRAPASACEKGMLPFPDPYRGGDWGWRRLHWIDVISTT